MTLPPITCVNLRSSVGRRERLEWRLERHGLLAQTTFLGVAGADVTGLDAGEAKKRRSADNLAAHLEAMRRFLEGPGDHSGGLIICEDDVLLHRDFGPLAEAAFANLPPDAPLLLLGHLLADDVADLVWAGVEPELHNLCRISRAAWGAHLYWSSEAWAREALARWGDLAVDELPAVTEHITILSGGYVAWPSLGLQEAAGSTIRENDDMRLHVEGQPWPREEYLLDGEVVPDPVGLPPPRKTIGLCMIVRDEAAVIERCLDSVRHLIDHWSIVDTGSTDGTPELIEHALAGIPGELHHREWRDFGHNRSESIELARGGADYLLLIDADMTVEERGPLPPLVADAYLLRHAGDVDYAIPRLVRADRDWRYEGSTHEYLATDGPNEQQTLAALVINHHADGGTRAEKFERDRRLLERDLAADPDDERATFYLAQTLRDLGETERAIELYRRRVTLGGWDEEVFYAAFQVGALLAREDDDEAPAALLSALERRPGRAEPLHELARFCRERGWHHSAAAFARQGLAIAYPEDRLFVHRDVYEWGLRFELSISAFYAGKPEQALEACEALLAGDAMPRTLAPTVRENRRHCLVALGREVSELDARAEPLSELVGEVEMAEIQLEVDPAWPQFNPTIAPDGDGFRLVVRSANYRMEGGGYAVRDGDGAVRTLNYLAHADAELAMRSVEPLVDELAGPERHPSLVRGYEDIRLVEAGGRWYGLAAVRDRNPEMRCEMALLELEGARIERTTLLAGPDPSRHEKNWMPFVRDGRLLLVYTCSPTVILECDPSSGRIEPVSELPAPDWASELRGGSQGVDVEGGTLFVTHDVVFGSATRSYRHRFVLIDEGLRLAAASRAFTFAGNAIEMCTGMAARGDELVLGFGVDDRIAGLALVPRDAALGLLEALPAAEAA